MHPRRQARFNELITQVVSSLVPTLKDPAMGFLTITGAEISPDVSIVRIFYSVLGSEQEKEGTALALQRAKPYFRRELAKLENMRRVPQLIFVFDESAEKADRVNRILNQINEEQNDGSH
jgi:ribosome-binding factor A